MAFLCLAAGCGRSDLTDELFFSIAPDDSGTTIVDSGPSNPPPVDHVLVPPEEDVFVPPPPPPEEDVFVPPPPPPVEDAEVPGDDAFIPTGGCNPNTCGGCCDANGFCQAGSDPNACGGQGEVCTSCDQLCIDGACLSLASNCGPSNCTGCCLGRDVCADGRHDNACGQGGMQCESCNATTGGGQCLVNVMTGGGMCQFPSSSGCNAKTCPMGCCAGDICATGAQDIACGSGGNTCANCTVSGQTCIARGCAF